MEQVDELKFPVRVAAFAAEYWPDGFENGDATHLGGAFVDVAASGDLLLSVVMAIKSGEVETPIAQRAKRVLETLAVQMHP